VKKMDKLEKWMTVVIIMNMTMVLVNVGGFFPMQNTLGDSTVFNSMLSIDNSFNVITTELLDANSIIDYTMLVGYALYYGIQIMIDFLLLIFLALEPLALLLSVPKVVYAPIQLVVDLIIIYNFGKLLFNR